MKKTVNEEDMAGILADLAADGGVLVVDDPNENLRGGYVFTVEQDNVQFDVAVTRVR